MAYRRWLALLVHVVVISALVLPVATRAEHSRVPVVLIHGQGVGPEITWETLQERFEQHGYRMGETLFALDLTQTGEEEAYLGLLTDTARAADQLRAILRRTGAPQADLIGHSRGGLIARMLASGDTAPLVRRVITLNTPHDGVLPMDRLRELFTVAGLDPDEWKIALSRDLERGSAALQTLVARERRFADRRPPALAIGTTWREGVPAALAGHDGAVPLRSQLAFPGAHTRVFRLGPSADRLSEVWGSELGALFLVWESPHIQSHESEEVFRAMLDFLHAPPGRVPSRRCEPLCRDWAGLSGHWSADRILPHLGGGLPYEVGPGGRRLFEPDRPMTRAEFIYGLVHFAGLEERLQPPVYRDMLGHWALGYVEAAREAGILTGRDGDRFEPDRAITRAEAVALIARAQGWEPDEAAARGLLRGDVRGYRPGDPLTMAEGAVLLIRAFGPQGQ